MNNRVSFEIEMTPEKVTKILDCIQNAKGVMTEGQTFRLEISHNVDLVFKGLKNTKFGTAISRETEAAPLVTNNLRTLT
jgi:hypothetical protein